MSLALALTKDPKENGIECAHDFNTSIGIAWTEIYYGNELVLQVDSKATVDQFIRIMQALHEDFDVEQIDDGTDIWVAGNNKRGFKKLIKNHGALFGIK